MQHDFTTPMMKQYMEIKKQYEDCLLFFRMGDFYELFMDDALTGAQVLNITLTSRPKGKDGRIPMAGVPFHAVDSYLSKLVKAGFKVAICEQMSPPNKYGIVEREVIRIVTPGTLLDEKALSKKENNFIVSIVFDEKKIGICAADISTGFFAASEFKSNNPTQVLKDELSKLSPAECILSPEIYNNPHLLKEVKDSCTMNIYCFQDWEQFAGNDAKVLKKHFKIKTLDTFGITQQVLTRQSAAALLGYLQQTQKSNVNHITTLTSLSQHNYLSMDRSTIINLELFSTIREHNKKGSLLHILDETVTATGGRLLKQWTYTPLTDKKLIEQRQHVVEEFLTNNTLHVEMRDHLQHLSDIERILSRLSVGLGNARDCINLKNSLQTTLTIRKLIKDSPVPLMKRFYKNLSAQIEEVIKIIDKNITDEPPISLREGGIIRAGIDNELDSLKERIRGSKEWIMELEKKERERTGISSLKVKFNKIFGFYIEISNANLSLAPDDYIRKQTLVNGERFITPELKHHEEIILSAEEKINELEYQLFLKILHTILDYTPLLQKVSYTIATLDCLSCFAHLADKNNYIKPRLTNSGKIYISKGRHPVVEQLLEEKQFVPNDVTLDIQANPIMLITGPNMAGKSVYIRQTALLVLMAQMGSFIPAESAEISIIDKIFVRSGASDVITSGLSTFMVEMVETAYILSNATENSLIVMDEIGRGTSTYDGISIAWAIAEYLATHFSTPPKTLFATHYHELQALEQQLPGKIKNYHMSVENNDGDPIFLHIIQEGGASHSFGVAVAKLAGIPSSVIDTAMNMLAELEHSRGHDIIKSQETDIALSDITDHLIIQELNSLDIHQMTPLEALNKLSQLKNKLKLFQFESSKYYE